MIDCVDKCHDQSFYKVEKEERERFNDNSLGIKNAYFVGSSRDYFQPYDRDGFKGYEIYNCVGSFILAVKDLDAMALDCALTYLEREED